jgi:hypothetical protein
MKQPAEDAEAPCPAAKQGKPEVQVEVPVFRVHPQRQYFHWQAFRGKAIRVVIILAMGIQ